MSTPKFATIKGTSTKTTVPFYIGFVQHESSMTKKETYDHLAEKLKFSHANIKAAFLGLGKILKKNADKGNDAIIDDVAHFKIYAKGAVESSTGPWVKGINSLIIVPLEADAFKNAMGSVIPENATEGLSPAISSVFDAATGEYDLVTGTGTVSIGGTNLGPDTTKTDEKVYLLFDDGTTLAMTIESSTLTRVTAKLPSAPTKTGKAKIVVATRCGLGEEFGIKIASRVVEVG